MQSFQKKKHGREKFTIITSPLVAAAAANRKEPNWIIELSPKK